MSYSMQQMQYFSNQNPITSSVIQKKFKPLHDPISEVQSKDEFSLNADILSSQQMNYSLGKQLLQFDKKKQGSAIDIIKMNAMHNSIEMSQRLIGSQVYTNNINRSFIEEPQHINTPKGNPNGNYNNLLTSNPYGNNQLQVDGDISLCLDASNNGIDQNEKVSTTYDPSNNIGTKPTTLSFMNQNVIAPVTYSNNFESNDLLPTENEEDVQEGVVVAEKKSQGKKSSFSNKNSKEKIVSQSELVMMNCPHCQKHIALNIQNDIENNRESNCANILHRVFSLCYSCSCNSANIVPQKHSCPECSKPISVSSSS